MPDPAASVSASAKVLSVLRELPLWLLSGMAVALISTLFLPKLGVALPDGLLPWLCILAILFSVLSVFRFGSILITNIKARRRRARQRERNALTRVYQPIDALLLMRHISTFQRLGAPRLRDRVQNAIDALRSGQLRRYRLHRRIKRACKAIFDRQMSLSGEVEYGGDFPRERIIEIVRENLSYADRRLLALVASADRAWYEDRPGPAEMTREDLELCDHVRRQIKRLRTR